MHRIGLALVIGIPLSTFAQSIQASDEGSNTLEEVVVTAEHRVSDVQKTASSISVRAGAELATEGRYQLSQILEDVPGVQGGAATAVASSPGMGVTDTPSTGLTIRGMQSNVPGQASIISAAPAAAIYVDGVYDGVGSSYDIDRVELLRGPQGTLYGRSATSGLVAIHTANPDPDKRGGNALAEFGNYALQHYAAAVNLPIVSDVLAVRIAGNRYQRDGFESAEGGRSTNTGGKLKLLYRPTEMFSVLLGAALENNEQNNGGVSIEVPSPGSYRTDAGPSQPIGGGNSRSRQYWAQVDWDLGPATLTYLPAYRTYKSEFNIPGVLGAVSFEQTGAVPDDDFVTHELRLASNEGSSLIWQIGSLYYKNSLSSTTQVQLFAPVRALALRAEIPNKRTYAVGVFGEATYTFAPSWRVTAGLRYDDTKVEVSETYTPPFNAPDQTLQSISGEAGTRKFDNTTYKARLEHDLANQNLLYASVSTGFTPGDVALTTSPTYNPIVLDLEDQTLTAYEIGSKNRFLNESLQVNGDIYYYDYGGFQQANVNFTPNAPTPSAGLVSIPVQSYGAEFEAIYQLTSKDRLSLNLAYTKAYFVDTSATRYPDGSGGYVTAADFFALDAVPNTVPFTGNLSYGRIVSLPGGSTLTLQGDARYVSEYESGPVSPTQLAQGAYSYIRIGGKWNGNLNATWASSNGDYAVTGYVRNVWDNKYATAISAVSQGGMTTYRATLYDPLTYGVVLSVRF